MTYQAVPVCPESLEIGSNLLGNASAANWTYTLPSLHCEVLLFIGRPSREELDALKDFACRVVIWIKRSQIDRLQEELERSNSDNVRICCSGADVRKILPPEGADVIRIKSRRIARKLLSQSDSLQFLDEFLATNGVIYLETHLARETWVHRIREMSESGFEHLSLWISPVLGEAMHFSPLQDQKIADRLLRHGGFAPTFSDRTSQRMHWWFLNHERVRRRFARLGVVIGKYRSDLNSGPPAYLRDVARESGTELERFHWGMWAGGRYLSKKILFFLYEDPEQSPKYVVKIPRSPLLNPRLERAYKAMRTIKDRDVFPVGTIPEVSFAGYHRGVAILGESVIEGQPFEPYAAEDSNGYFLGYVLSQFLRLGAMTRVRSPDSIKSKLAWLEDILRQFLTLYCPEPAVQTFLQQQVQCLRDRSSDIQLVFQHGDPGTWNLLVRDHREVSILDWEAAEPQGLPLWDTFYFIQAYTQVTGKRRGANDSVSRFKEALLDEPDTGNRVIQAIDRYCQVLELDHELVAPLFFTCWMHRAVKEATRLEPKKLQSGHYYRLLKLCMGERNNGMLRRLLSARSTHDVAVEGYT